LNKFLFSGKRCPPDTFEQKLKISAKKKKSSEKERVRNLQIKKFLEEIRKHIPHVEKNLSKIRTLRLASEYINHLQRILGGEMVSKKFSRIQYPTSRFIARSQETTGP
jgi:hypothetical protein